MELSEYTIVNLSKAVCGDADGFMYMKGYELVHYFNKFGYNEQGLGDFVSRKDFTITKLRELNGSDSLREIVEHIVNPRRFFGAANGLNYDNAAIKLNEIITYDQYELRKVDKEYKVFNSKGLMVTPVTTKGINHEFIDEQINKCFEKINANDYNGAITNARSLLEALFIEIIEKHDNTEVKNDGNLDGLWSRVKKILKMELDRDHMPDYVIQILSGIDTTIKGFAGLSNNAGDRHATKFRTRKHHAKLAVNLTMSIGDFLLDSWNFQTEKVSNLVASITE